jgi:hypothetical protein
MPKILPYSQLLKVLTNLVDKKTSGTLFIRSDSNHAITIALNAGKIHAMYFGAKRGRKAIPLISEISAGSYRFEASDFIENSHDLPPTQEILGLLREPKAAGKAATTSSTPPAGKDKKVREEQKTILCQQLKALLSEHIGPIAEIIFDDIAEEVGNFCATPQLTHDLINKLSEEIGDGAEVEQFRSKAYTVLNSFFKD